MPEPFDLDRFVQAQDPLARIRRMTHKIEGQVRFSYDNQ
jgi:uncharacterized protein (DUF1810 family)